MGEGTRLIFLEGFVFVNYLVVSKWGRGVMTPMFSLFQQLAFMCSGWLVTDQKSEYVRLSVVAWTLTRQR